jgi:hypothetical protein
MIARLISIIRDVVSFAELSFAPLLDLFIRLRLAQSFCLRHGQAASWNTVYRLQLMSIR